MVEVLPTLLHVSLFLFFDGLVVFLWNVDLTIFKLVLSWVGLCAALYGFITFMPIIRHNSPCHTPLSSWVWLLGSWIRYVFNSSHLSALWVPIRDLSGLSVLIHRLSGLWVRIRRLPVVWARTRDLSGLSVPIRGLSVRIRTLLYMGMQKAVEKTALHSPSEIVTRAFLWTFDSLDEDHELERFFSGLPGFRSSKVVEDPLLSLPSEQKEKLSTTLMGLFDRTFSSDLLPEPAKNRRAVICAKALDPAEFPYAYWQIINRILFDDQCRGLQTAEFGRVMRSWGGGGDRRLVVEVIFASIVARAQRYGDPWLLFASNELGIPESDLRDYAAQGDNWSLAALIHITRQQFDHLGESSWPRHGLSKVLGAASEFNVQNTSPQLQHEFCALWHQVVRKAWVNGWWITWDTTLRPIRNVYIALHQDTPTQFSASTRDEANEDFDGDRVSFHSISYPLCNIPGHHPEPTPHTHNVSASTTPARTALYDNAALSPAPLAGPDVPSSSVPAPRRVDESLTDVPPLDNNIYVPGSFHAAYQTVIEHLRIPATSQDPVTARVIQGGIGISTTMIPLSAPEPLASTHPTSMASTSPPGAVAVQHIADRRTSSDVLDVPSLPSPTPVLDNMLPTGPHSSLDSPVTGSDHPSSSSPESHSSPLAPAVPSLPHPRLTSAPDLGAAAEGDGSTKAAFRKRKEEDTLYSSSEIRNNIITTSDPPPQSPSPPSVTDIAIAGPSQRTLDAEHTKDNPPHPSHGQFDIV